jgi:hypothetical protein
MELDTQSANVLASRISERGGKRRGARPERLQREKDLRQLLTQVVVHGLGFELRTQACENLGRGRGLHRVEQTAKLLLWRQ